jgi:hypothetical protein
MGKFTKGQIVRHAETKSCGQIMRSFPQDGATWYQVVTMHGDATEEWEESKLRGEPEIFSII